MLANFLLLGFVPAAVSHVLVTNAYGNANPGLKTYGLGLLENTNRQDHTDNQIDVAVFSDPTQAPTGNGGAKGAGDKWYCKKCPIYDQECAACKGIPDCKKCFISYDPNCSACRTRNIASCGRTLYTSGSKYYVIDTPSLSGTDARGSQWNTGRLNTDMWVEWMLEQKYQAQVTAGGWLNVTMAQQNTDGGGPYTCEIDESGKGTDFKPLETTGQDCLGKYGANLCNDQDWYVGAIMPKDLKCTGTNGATKNLCMVRCKNDAPNGPFGGCISIQQVPGKPQKFPPLGKQNFCKNGMWTKSGPYTDKIVRYLAGNDNLKQADIEYLIKEVGGTRPANH
ncbi:hypothetical protein AA313_de0204868 [Arthrobotrys entomopaga]|nr:hypothetical protein AA313_de0204868 [Arthrobotrys entomopaga]